MIRNCFVLFLVLLVALLVGCKSVDLEEKWEPLKEMRESAVLGPPGTGAMTMGDTVYVRSIEKWQKAHPKPLDDAILLHEQVHSVRQFAYPGGMWSWIKRYATDTDFMWAEEQLGWYTYIRHVQSKGLRLDVDRSVRNLAGYRNLVGQMVSKEEARAWVILVLRSQWHPN